MASFVGTEPGLPIGANPKELMPEALQSTYRVVAVAAAIRDSGLTPTPTRPAATAKTQSKSPRDIKRLAALEHVITRLGQLVREGFLGH